MERDYSSKIDTGHKQYGAICPEGKFYSCGYAEHRYLEDRLESKGILKGGGGWKHNAFEWNGWVKLTGSYMTVCEFQFKGNVTEYDFEKKEDILIKEVKITQAQVDAITAYIKSLDRELLNFNFAWFSLEDFQKIVDYDDIHEFRYQNEKNEPEDERAEVDKGY